MKTAKERLAEVARLLVEAGEASRAGEGMRAVTLWCRSLTASLRAVEAAAKEKAAPRVVVVPKPRRRRLDPTLN